MTKEEIHALEQAVAELASEADDIQQRLAAWVPLAERPAIQAVRAQIRTLADTVSALAHAVSQQQELAQTLGERLDTLSQVVEARLALARKLNETKPPDAPSSSDETLHKEDSTSTIIDMGENRIIIIPEDEKEE